MKRILIITCSGENELNIPELKKENEKYIQDLYGSRGLISRIFRKPDTEVIFLMTGLGKLKSYRGLQKALSQYKPSDWIKVVNLGTAGSDLIELGESVVCGRFIDADMAFYDIEDDWMILKDSDIKISCNSRDIHVTNLDDSFQRRDGWSVVCDSEAYGQAKCCEEFGVSFGSHKFITNKFTPDYQKEKETMMPKAYETLTKIASRYIFNFYYAKG